MVVGREEDDPFIYDPFIQSSVEEARWETVDSDLAEEASWETVDSDLAELIASKIDIKHAKQDIAHGLPSSSSHLPCQFKHFDSVKDAVDHYYQNETGQVHLWKGIIFLSLFVTLFGKSNIVFLVQYDLSY